MREPYSFLFTSKSMKLIYFFLIFFLFSPYGYSQFDLSGYRFLCLYDGENLTITTNFKDSNFYILRNTGKPKEGLLLESYSIISCASHTAKYLFTEEYTQRNISQISVEQFDYDHGRLAVLSNQGIFYARSPQERLRPLSVDISAFEFNTLELTDSTLYIFRHSLKTIDQAFFEVIALDLETNKITRLINDDVINARVYSNFPDSRLIATNAGAIYRADYVLPVIYHYHPQKDTLPFLNDALFSMTVEKHIMPDDLIRFTESYASESAIEYLDTTFKLKYSFFTNRQLILSNDAKEMILLSSFPDTVTGMMNPFFILTELSVSDTALEIKRSRVISKTRNMDQPINHALDVIGLWEITHIAQDESAWYLVIRNATALSPAGMTAKEYYTANYRLQFEKTGFGVIRLEK